MLTLPPTFKLPASPTPPAIIAAPVVVLVLAIADVILTLPAGVNVILPVDELIVLPSIVILSISAIPVFKFVTRATPVTSSV